MDLNNYNAVLQQLSSAPGLQEQLRKHFAMSEGLGTIHLNSRPVGSKFSDYALGPEMTAELATSKARRVQALPYQTGSGPGEAWPGDPNWKGPIQDDPAMREALLRYMKTQMGFQVSPFQLPSAPPLQ